MTLDRIKFDNNLTIEDIDLDQEVIHVTGPDGQPIRYTNAMAEADGAQAEQVFAELARMKRAGPK